MKVIQSRCQGESHKATNKVCQDYCLAESNDASTIAIVCDGHGGSRYFRSDVGAVYAAEVAKECVGVFLQNVESQLFSEASYTAVEAITTERSKNDLRKKNERDRLFQQLFSSIIYNWHERILKHAEETPLSEEEKQTVDPKHIADFEKTDAQGNRTGLEKTYGCTLMCYVQTNNYWFAFHLGDGKCIFFDASGSWKEAIPWDERCFLNKTTSLCDSDAIDEFRYCYGGKKTFPMAICLGSDGIDDSFGETTNMVNFYVQILKLLGSASVDDAQKELDSTLPELSRIGSKDDMSVVCVYNDTILPASVNNLIEWQRGNVKSQIFAVNDRIKKLQAKKVSFQSVDTLSSKDKIDYDYCIKEIGRAFETKKDLASKYDKLSSELLGKNRVPYTDEIGFLVLDDNDIPNQPSSDEVKEGTNEEPKERSNIELEDTDTPSDTDIKEDCIEKEIPIE